MGDNDSFSSSTTQSWGSRLMDSIKSVGIGFLVFLGSFVLLWWNEGRSVQTYKSLKEGKGAVVSIQADKIDAANAGKLVHVSGGVTALGELRDTQFGVAVKDKIALKTSVEMYQWKESCSSQTEKNLGGSQTTKTECTYSKDWAANAIDSSKFKKPTGHKNPPMNFRSTTQVAKNAKLGAFDLPQNLASSLSSFSKLELEQDTLQKIRSKSSKKAAIVGDSVYVGADENAPELGDYKIEFEKLDPTTASVVAVQQNASFAPYNAKAGDSIYMISEGNVTAEAMFKSAQASNATLTWILRFVGWLAMTIGLTMVFKPFTTLLDVVPFLGSIFGAGIGFASGIVSFALALLTIAVAWLFYRPLLSIILIAVGVGAVILYRQRAAAKKQAASAPTA